MRTNNPTLTLPKYGHHQVFCGSTESGKTTLGAQEVKYYDSYFIFDTQEAFGHLEGVKIKDPKSIGLLLSINTKKIIYQPKKEYRTRAVFDRVIDQLVDSSRKTRQRPRIIWVDEVFHLGYRHSFPEALPVAMATARQRGISLWINTQRPKNVPVQIFTEAKYLNVFYLTRLDDMKTVAEYARQDVKEVFGILQNQTKDFRFLRVDLQTAEWQVYHPIDTLTDMEDHKEDKKKEHEKEVIGLF